MTVVHKQGRVILTCTHEMEEHEISHAKAVYGDECGFVEGHCVIATSYVTGEEQIAERPIIHTTLSVPTIQANGTDICLISGIPEGATVTSSEFFIVADGSDLEFVTDIPGEHKLKITLWPYMDAEVVIDAT